MSFKSYGPRMVVFVIAAGIMLIAAVSARAASTDDVVSGAAPALERSDDVGPDNDDNPRVSRSDGLDADDRPLTTTEQAKVTAAAAQAVGSGTVTEMEASDDFGTAYEAEVYDRAGTEWDIELDAKFAVVSKSRDS